LRGFQQKRLRNAGLLLDVCSQRDALLFHGACRRPYTAQHLPGCSWDAPALTLTKNGRQRPEVNESVGHTTSGLRCRLVSGRRRSGEFCFSCLPIALCGQQWLP
ncbi:hypothetical protein J6590_072623, partial [Homalodisca vitripennis]